MVKKNGDKLCYVVKFKKKTLSDLGSFLVISLLLYVHGIRIGEV